MGSAEREGPRGTRFRLNEPAVIADVIDGEAVIMNLERGSYYGLDKVGADIWRAILAGRASDEIADAIARRFSIERERVSADVRGITHRMLEEGLIVAASDGAWAPSDIEITTASYVEPTLTVYSDMKDLLAFDPPMPGMGTRPPA
jgi:hypothetical protein